METASPGEEAAEEDRRSQQQEEEEDDGCRKLECGSSTRKMREQQEESFRVYAPWCPRRIKSRLRRRFLRRRKKQASIFFLL
ncbi:MAG: hypothetical protein ABSA81_09300 [Candidatus Bathyarchaeia archaeon]